MPVLSFLNLLEIQAGVGENLKEFIPFLSCWRGLGRGLGEDPGKESEGATWARASPRQWPQVPGSRGAREAQGGSRQTLFSKFMKHPSATQLSHAEDPARHSESWKS